MDADAQDDRNLAVNSGDYVRFVILSGPRTGSHMLAQALNSSPHVTCFREIFNPIGDFIQFDVAGYDNFSAKEMAERKAEPLRFLKERIFCDHPQEVRAVGFKLHFGQSGAFPGLLERLAIDEDLHVVHLKRRNLLRMLVSLNFARTTKVWVSDQKPAISLAKLLVAARHPRKAAARLQQRLRSSTASRDPAHASMTVSVDELYRFIINVNQHTRRFEELFRSNPTLTVYYEDILADRDKVFGQAQGFLGIEPAPLTVTMSKQNPEPLRELIENYDELRLAFKDTPHAVFFD